MKKSVFATIAIAILILVALFASNFTFNNIEEMSYPSFIEAVGKREVYIVNFKEDASHFRASLHSDVDKEYKILNPKTDDFIEYLLLHEVEIEYIEDGLPRYIQGPLAIIIILGVILLIRKNTSQNFKVFDSNKAPEIKSHILFDDIAGNTEAKSMVKDIIHFLKEPEKYNLLGARMPKGLLFYGPPGTGKTMMAKAIAAEADVPFYAVSGSDFVQMYVGVGASRIRKLFQKAKKDEKAVIFIDEIDAIGKKRGRSVSASNDERDQTLNALLTEMSGFADNKGVIVIGATNRLDTLDDALLRPGRFDRQVEVGLPDINARYKILSLYANNKPISKKVNLHYLSKSTVGFSGAMLENLLNEAAILAANENQSLIEASHIDKAFYTVFQSKKQIKANIQVLLAGRIAEELVFGKDEVTTGASNDIKKASSLMMDYINKYGMDSDLGIFNSTFASDLADQKLLEGCRNNMNKLYEETLSLVEDNIKLLKQIANSLLENESIKGEDIDRLIA